MIGVVNYGLGNVRAFLNVYKHLGIEAMPCSSSSDLDQCDHLILPGVGSFDCAMTKLNSSGMRDHLDDLVLNKKIPVLGICVGFQIMAHSSDEGSYDGLSWFDASVVHLSTGSSSTDNLPYPHMGWNNITFKSNARLFQNLEASDSRFYFLHSFYFHPQDSSVDIASACYGHNFCCSASLGNIYGVQFHPEKSHSNGVILLNNFSLL